MRRTPAIAALALVALAAAACSSGSSTSSTPSSSSGGTVDFYSSLPMQGASSAQTIPLVNGIKLALSQANNKAGQWTVKYTVLDDSTAAAGKWDPGQTAADARQVASDPKAVYYMGEFNSGQCPRRAAEVLPDREAHLPADRPDRLDPGRRRPDGDEASRLHQGRRGQ